jgi:hypothetical protein
MELRWNIRTASHGTSPWQRNITIGNNITIHPTHRMGRKAFMVHYQTVGPCHNGQNRVNEGFSPIARDSLPSYLFITSHHAPRTLLLTMHLSPQTRLFYTMIIALLPSIPLQCLSYSSNPKISNPEHVCRTSSVL